MLIIMLLDNVKEIFSKQIQSTKTSKMKKYTERQTTKMSNMDHIEKPG